MTPTSAAALFAALALAAPSAPPQDTVPVGYRLLCVDGRPVAIHVSTPEAVEVVLPINPAQCRELRRPNL